MAASTLERALALVFGHEGGFQNRRSDRGNWTTGIVGKGQLKGTKYGISAMSYPTLDIESLTLAQAAAIYRRDYWTTIRGDDLPVGVDYVVFDFAINSGPHKAAMVLQECVGVANDGEIGPITLQAVSKTGPHVLIGKICTARLAFLRRLSTWPEYGGGWTTRVKDVERDALRMAGQSLPDVEPTTTLQPTSSAGFFMRFLVALGRQFI